MGLSKPWPDAMEALTGQREMSALPLLSYFRPLQEWLEKENARNGEFIGWKIAPTSGANSIFKSFLTLFLVGFASSLSLCL